MFKKLKEKITEEVKISPQRFQQLTQTVSDRLQSASTSDENFFSIAEDDVNTSLDAGFTNVSLVPPQDHNDVSFLPRYDSTSNMYHLQSDLEVSASEMEDNASTSSQLGHLSKEQIYAAFQKSQMRYHKYRGRYTDLAKHYKDLERENGKIKLVLVETQDKAIRRVNELKEQCSLEQKAKAHLESSLRDEMDERQLKIEALQTKVELLQNGAQDPETLHNEKIQELKAHAIIFQSKEQEYKTRISSLEKEILLFSEREKESNLSIAQNKMQIHNELLIKDGEITTLRQDNEVLKRSLEAMVSGNKLENLQIQNKNLIEKLESLSQRCNSYDSELLKMEHYRLELQSSNEVNADLKSQLKKAEADLETVREGAKSSLLSIETKIMEKLKQDFEEKELQMRREFERRLEEVSNSSSLKELQLSLMSKEEEVKKLSDLREHLTQELSSKTSKYSELEANHLELIEDSVQLRGKVSTLEKEVSVLQSDNQVYIRKNLYLEENLKILEALKEETESIEESSKARIAEAQELRNNLTDKERELEELKKEAAQRVDSLNTQEAKMKDFEDMLQSHVLQNSQLLKVGDSLNAQIKDLEDTTRALEEDLRSLHKELENEVQSSKALVLRNSQILKENEELRRELSKMGDSASTKDEDIRSLTTSLKSKDAEVEDLQSTVRSLQLKSESLKSKDALIEDLQTKIRALNVELQMLKDLREVEDLRIEELRSELSTVGESLKSKDEDIRSLTTSLKSKDAEVEDLQGTVQSLQLKSESLKSKDALIEDLQTKIRALSSELQTLEDLREKVEESRTLGESLKSKDAEVEDLQCTVRSLHTELAQFRQSESSKSKDTQIESLETKIRELSTELQTLKDSRIEELRSKDQDLQSLRNELKDLNSILKGKEEQMDVLSQKLEEYICHSAKVHNSESNNIERKSLEEKLLLFERLFTKDKENLSKVVLRLKEYEERCASAKELEDQLRQVREENLLLIENQKTGTESINALESRNVQLVSDSNFLSQENDSLMTELEEVKSKSEVMIHNLKARITNLEEQNTSTKATELEHRLNDLTGKNETLQQELQETRDKLKNEVQESYDKEVEALRTKIVQYKSLDLTNRSSIEFYENELQKVKNQNEKLHRKLDETLVTLNHCSELSNSTEIEYLRNVLYNYMLGKESLVLARVIAAVCKFDPHQTEAVLTKEQQKQTLLGQLGIL